MEITEEKYNELKKKADKWDELDNELSEIYGDGYNECNETDLAEIGEICAIYFGYL